LSNFDRITKSRSRGLRESEAHKYRALKEWQAMYPYSGEEEVAVSPEPAPRAGATPDHAHLADPSARYDIRGRLISGLQEMRPLQGW
jgi:hypothetical protein